MTRDENRPTDAAAPVDTGAPAAEGTSSGACASTLSEAELDRIVLNAAILKQTFAGLLGEAKTPQQEYLPQIRRSASTLDLNQILQSVRA